MTANRQLSNYIDGAWMGGSGAPFDVINPASGAIIWSGNDAAQAEVDAACQAARAAFPAWSQTSLEQRIAICEKFRDLLKQHAEELTALIASEVGKPLWEARTEVATMANTIDISVQSYNARTGTVSAKVADGDAVRARDEAAGARVVGEVGVHAGEVAREGLGRLINDLGLESARH